MGGWSTRRGTDPVRPQPATGRDTWFMVGVALIIALIAHLTDPGSRLDLALLAPAVIAFAMWGLVPNMPAEAFAVLVTASVTAAVARDGNLEGSLFLVVVMVLYTSWHLESLSRAVTVLLAAAAVAPLIAEVCAPGAGIAWPPWTTACGFTFLLGRELKRQQALISQLEQARRALADQAVAEERRRMARELHDLAGHTLAAMLLHVTGARHVLRRDIDEAERALHDAETVGRSSLDQIRAAVAALRTHEQGTDPALAASADIAELVDEYRRAGLNIGATVKGRVADLDGAIAIALHRIARESLANVAHHAPDNRVEVAVDAGQSEIHLVVTDHGHPAAVPDPNQAHFGLVGMRERARALGGDLVAGPTPDGWAVDARLPAVLADSQELAPS